MKKYKWIIILLNLVILLVYFNYSVAKKEELLKSGQLVLLQLAPIDPRSLMQGDYMNLRYSISENIYSKYLPKRGYCVVRLDDKGIAERIRFQQEKTPLNKGEYVIKYTAPNEWNINIGAESFFFQEGQAKKYEKAKYGGVKIDENGNSLLIGLYDEQLNNIK
ncbi:GDYXXLXY domain-containing protein [Chryseobacterium soli]|uniref:GDYXXLXY domain-containing protein n=1 Tax=Chryseobacterium soli TaxID=445961 RepID=UPI002954BC23|nr:GDYXXLXY domain-containing protein [Chryseobacterium soli]MDV7699374.1 GDYXXLXY domain-containing protein [Chryseobacterium soli]